MIRYRKWVSAITLMIVLTLPFNTFAYDFWETIDFSLQPTDTPGVLGVDSKIYSARITGQWTDTDNDDYFDALEVLAESVKLYDRDGKLVLESPDTVRTREELEAWALANADIIYDTIFGGNPSFAVGTLDDVAMSLTSFSEVVFEKVVPQRKQLEVEDITDEFKAAVEYLTLDINGDDGYALSALMGYSHDFDNGFNLGFLLPYRYTDMSDDINTDSHYAGLFLFAKKPVVTWDDVEMHWTIGGDLFGSAFYSQSDAISDMGTLKYGGGVYSSLTKYWGVVGLSLGVDFKITKASAWDAVIDDDDPWVQAAVDYVNDLEPLRAFSYGCNVGVPLFQDDAAVNIETIRTHFNSDDIDSARDTQTILGVTFSYYPTDTFELTFGGHGTFELEDVEIYGITLGSIYRY